MKNDLLEIRQKVLNKNTKKLNSRDTENWNFDNKKFRAVLVLLSDMLKMDISRI